MSFGSGGPVNERVLCAGLCGRGTGTPACSDDDSPGDCKSVLVAIESFFRHGCAGGNHGTSRNGEGSIGVNAIIVGAVTVDHSAIDHDSIRRVNTIVVGDNFYRSAFNCEGGFAFYTFAILAPGCFNSDVTTFNREISIAFNTFGRGVQTTVYLRFTRGCHIYRAILNRESSVTVNAFTRGAATGDR